MGHAAATVPRFAAGRSRRRSARRAVRNGLLLAAAVGLVAARTLRRVEVVGGSMAPALQPGDRLLVVRRPFGPPAWPAVGDVVAVADPREPGRLLVKRVAEVDVSAGTVDLRGDAAHASTDSRTFGPVPRTSLLGRAVHRYGPAHRSGPGPWPPGYDLG